MHTKHAGGRFIVDLFHHLNLKEVIAGPKGAQLRDAPFLGLLANLIRIRLLEAPTLFGKFQVFLIAIALLDGPPGAIAQHLVHLFSLDP
ncbi:MAG: hypothetical protein DDT26_02111 [Dehalococcoidia bacterium]|nr:hypothetical protein [Chloroflexota bacterium]